VFIPDRVLGVRAARYDEERGWTERELLLGVLALLAKLGRKNK
jgi:hypothetical protein